MDKQYKITEQRNPKTHHFDQLSTFEMVQLMNNEDQNVFQIVKNSLKEIALLIDEVFVNLRNGGRLIYIGAGTSGRLGVLDASECPPTFGVDSNLVQGIIAGGIPALQNAIEGAEDDIEQAIIDLKNIELKKNDFLIGIASSGSTPYVLSALKYANSIQVKTGSITCTENNEISHIANFPIELITGPEVISGSTRLKAGTSQKLVLNMISTCVMAKLGKVYGNYMVGVKVTNKKLHTRAINMLMDILDVNEKEAQLLLEKAQNNVKSAIIIKLLNVSYEKSLTLLNEHHGKVRKVIEMGD